MGKKYTVVVFDSDSMGKVRTISLGANALKFVFLCVVTLIVVSSSSIYMLNKVYKERNDLLTYVDENDALKAKIMGYVAQLDEINDRMGKIAGLEDHIRGLISLNSGDYPVKDISVGGEEFDMLKSVTAIGDRREKEFFNDLNNNLLGLSLELGQRAVNLSDLVDLLEEQQLLVSSTPTIWPTKGWVSSDYGYRTSPFTGRRVFHEGIDIAASTGTDIRAAADGVVVFSKDTSGYGKMVSVDHGYGYVTRYGHCSRLLVKVGDVVKKGDIIAKVGSSGKSTGPHLHYEVLVRGVPVNPVKFLVEHYVAND